eukprot:403363234
MKVNRHFCNQSVCNQSQQQLPGQEFVSVFVSSVTEISYICYLDNLNININTVSPKQGQNPEIRKYQITNSSASYGYCSQIVVKDQLTSPTKLFYAMAYHKASDYFVYITGYLNLGTATQKIYESALGSTHIRFLFQKIAKSSYDFVLTWGYYVDKVDCIYSTSANYNKKLFIYNIRATNQTFNNTNINYNAQSSILPIEGNKVCRAISPPDITQITFELGDPTPQYFYIPKVDIDIPGWYPWTPNSCTTVFCGFWYLNISIFQQILFSS